MADWAARYADRSADELRDRIRAIYLQAGVELQQKMQDFAQRSADRDAYMRQRVADGKMTPEQYRRWQQGQVFTGRQWQQKVHDATQAYVDADRIAGQLVNGVTHGVFVEAANYTAYHIERTMGGGVAFNLYDESTVERLLLDDPKMLPEWRIDRQKDYTWNEQRVRNAVTQGIIQGESVRQIGQRLCVGLAAGNAAKMNMFARTAVTGAQNAGRVERLREAQDMGIQVRKVWLATLDERTREEHADLDGQERDIDKPFETSGYTIDYPGDPDAAPEMVFNCRCTLIYSYPRHRSDPSPRYDQQDGEVIDDTNYARWWESKHPGQTWEQHMQEHREGRGRTDGGGEETAQETAAAEPEKPKPIHAQFTPASSIQEAEEFARQFVSGSVSYRGLSLDAANACNQALADIAATYGVESLGTVQPMNMRTNVFKNTTAEAAYRWGSRELFINPKYYKNAGTFSQHVQEISGLMQTVLRSAQQLIDSGRVTGAKRVYVEALIKTGRQCVSQSHNFMLGTFIHENGHRLDDAIFRPALREAFGATRITLGDMLTESRRTYGGNISGYATADNQEYIAESFTAWWFGEGDKCDPRIVSVFEGMVKK